MLYILMEKQVFNFYLSKFISLSCKKSFLYTDEWPIWRTRTPVVIALRHHHGRIEHHRYRYMVVTPGVDPKTRSPDESKETMHGGEEEMNVDTERGLSLGATTGQNDANVATHIMAWEEPYKEPALVSVMFCVSCYGSHLCYFS